MSTVTTVPIANITLQKYFSKIAKYGDDLRNVGMDIKAQASSDLWAIAKNSDNESFMNYLITTSTTTCDTAMQGLQIDSDTLSAFFTSLNNYATSFDGITSFDAFLTDQNIMAPENFADLWYAVRGERLSRANIMPSLWKKATSTTYNNVLGTITWTDGTAAESSVTSASLSSNISSCYPICASVTANTDLAGTETATATLTLNSAGDETLSGANVFSLANTALGTQAVGDYTWPCGAVAIDESNVSSGTITFPSDESTFGTNADEIYASHYADATDNYIRYIYIMGCVTVSGTDYVVGQKLAITGATPGSDTLSYTSSDLLYTFKSSTDVVIFPMYYGYTALAGSDTGVVDGAVNIRPFDVFPETYDVTLGDDEDDYDGIVDDWAGSGSFPTTA